MKQLIKIIMIFFTLLFSQTDDIKLLSKETNNYQPFFRDRTNLEIPLEREIDPKDYLLGPGDQLHIVVNSLENRLFPGQEYDLFTAETVEYFEFIGPAGELTLPSIGQFSTKGKSYQMIKDEIILTASNKSYKKIQTTVQLSIIRSFKVQVIGAVENPGYVVITAVDRVKDAIDMTNGVQKYGDNKIVFLERNGKRQKLFLKEFLLNGDLNQNPTLLEGDKIIVPFIESIKENESKFTEYKTSLVVVSGFVILPSAYPYIAGYKASDYIAMVGGTLTIGNKNKTIIYRADGSNRLGALDEFVEPGDVIFVPESFRSRFLGNISILQTATAIATLYLTFIAATTG
mgnify:FL=1